MLTLANITTQENMWRNDKKVLVLILNRENKQIVQSFKQKSVLLFITIQTFAFRFLFYMQVHLQGFLESANHEACD